MCLAERVTKTVQIEKKYLEIEERGVKLRLTIVDTPGFNDSMNEVEWYRHVCIHILTEQSIYIWGCLLHSNEGSRDVTFIPASKRL